MIYKVIVGCIGEQPRFGKPSKNIRTQMAALVEAEGIDEAIDAGIKHVQEQAPMDCRWFHFDLFQCSPVPMPILVKSV